MQKAGRIQDRAFTAVDAHGCPSCPHPAAGPATAGSANVLINGRRALRIEDTGIHASCCGPNEWAAVGGAPRVLINDRPAHRLGDATRHCGGFGKLATGSPSVLIGNYKKNEQPRDSVTEVSFDVWGHRLENDCHVVYDDGTIERVPLVRGFARISHPGKIILRVVLDID